MKIATGRKDLNGDQLFVGDKIKVPDNPDICPYDIGEIKESSSVHIKQYMSDEEYDYSYGGKYKFVFCGQLSITPLDHYLNSEIEKLEER